MPKFNPYAVLTRKKSWRHRISADELLETNPLMDQMAALRRTGSGPWINGLHLACAFIRRRIQPLQNHLHPMWEYSGPKDSTRTRADELSHDELDTRIRAITNIVGEDTPFLVVRPFDKDHPPTMVIV